VAYRSLKLLLVLLIAGCGLTARLLGRNAAALGRARAPTRQRCERVLVLAGDHPEEGLHCLGSDPGALPGWLTGRGLQACASTSGRGPLLLRLEEPAGQGECPLAAGELSAGALYTLGLPLELNGATAAALQTLPGVGPVTARRIVEDRRRRGPFRSVEALQRVRGVGPKTVARLRGRLRVEGNR